MHALLVVATLAAAATSDVAAAGAPRARVPGHALLKLKDVDDARALLVGKSADASTRVLSEIGARHHLKLSFVKASLFGWAVVDVRGEDGASLDEDATAAVVSDLAKDEAVDVAAEETWMKKLATPNDPGLGQMWPINQIGAKAAWDLTTGLSSQRVGVADTGVIRNHEDLRNRIVGGFDFVASANAGNDGNGRDADFNDPGDDCGQGSSFHGTHVAGTIGAEANNGKGTVGLNWNAGLVIARVLGRCGGSNVDIMEGAAWMAGAHIDGVPDVGANKVSVMNLSLGAAARCSAYEQQFIDFINNQGTIFVAAAGNDGGAVGSPANCRGAIAVAAVGATNRLAGYSSFGSEIAIAGPGGDENGAVLSTVGPGTADYEGLQGTSMASPHITGAISLVQALRPGISRNDVVTLLRTTGGACTGCQGVPALRLGAALASLGAPTQQPPPVVTPPTTTQADDAFEDNDTPATATRATCGVDDTRPIAAAGDQDWYAFTPPQGRRLAIAIDGGANDLDLYVLDSTGRNILARSEGTTGAERITGTAGGGTLMVLVNPYTDAARGIANHGAYRLTLTCGSATTQAVSDFDAGDPFEEVLGEVDDGEPLEPIADAVNVDAVDIEGGDGIEVSGGCNAGGAAASPVVVVALLALLRRRRR